jgi:signal transduction histidine kinase/ActR/RegA family two-component response regulator
MSRPMDDTFGDDLPQLVESHLPRGSGPARALRDLRERVALADTIAVVFAFATLLYVPPLWLLHQPASAMLMCVSAIIIAMTPVLNRIGWTTLGRATPTVAGALLVTTMTSWHGVNSQIGHMMFCLLPASLLLFAPSERRFILAQHALFAGGLLIAWGVGANVPADRDLAVLWPHYPMIVAPVAWLVTLGLSLRLLGDTARRTAELELEVEERMQSELRVRETMAAAEQVGRARADFAATVSHEIRTPLNGVLGLTELLSATVLTPRQREMVTLLQSSGEFLRIIIDDILDFSRIDNHQLHIEPAPFLLGNALEDCLAPFAQVAARKQLALCAEVTLAGDVEVLGDVARFKQIISNLLSNAIKFTPQGVVVVRLHARKQGDQLLATLEVEDTGVGIPFDELATIFEPYAQLQPGRERRTGTGLGLTICRRLASLMGGVLEVRSQVDVGSTFTLRLPLSVSGRVEEPLHLDGARVAVLSPFQRQVDALVATLQRMGALASGGPRLAGLPEDVDVVIVDHTAGLDAPSRLEVATRLGLPDRRVLELRSQLGDEQTIVWPTHRAALHAAIGGRMSAVPDPGAVGLAAPRDTFDPSFLGLHALVAEDNTVNQLVLRGYLAELGITCDVVTDGRTACESFDPARHQVVFMDLQMPDVDGAQATAWIREHAPGGATVPIIAITADSSANSRAAGIVAGFDEYLTKPLRAGGIRDAVARFFPTSNTSAS